MSGPAHGREVPADIVQKAQRVYFHVRVVGITLAAMFIAVMYLLKGVVS